MHRASLELSPGATQHLEVEQRRRQKRRLSPPEDLLDPGTEPASPGAPALAGGFFTTETPGKPTRMVPRDEA